MVEKIFKIVSNSDKYLTADIVAEALLKHITLNSSDPKVSFGVIEIKKNNCKEDPTS
ncbi:MAG: hypothetical protein NC822_03035 [Candidatus Omnitrophica bacterium]|nr:hypothetical protein [Candidatus Omnitrophota bacterium]MCM8827169.1 hypothetical protein [Candidatus Omnitrophota bacterium]